MGNGGKLFGISTQAKPNASPKILAAPFKNGQVGVATVAEIEAAGGRITLDGKLNSLTGTHIASHATVDNLTAQEAAQIFHPRDNPVPKDQRGKTSCHG
jgi:hypothetical protein